MGRLHSLHWMYWTVLVWTLGLSSWEMVVASETTSDGAIFRPEVSPEWAVVGQIGNTRTVYLSADGLRDRTIVAQMLRVIIEPLGRKKSVEVMFFDDRLQTPTQLPPSDEQLLHLRARYVYNPATRFERFTWVTVVDARQSPPRLKETEDRIRPWEAG